MKQLFIFLISPLFASAQNEPFKLEYLKIGITKDNLEQWIKTENLLSVGLKGTPDHHIHSFEVWEKLYYKHNAHDNNPAHYNKYKYLFDNDHWICLGIEIKPFNVKNSEHFLLSNGFIKSDSTFISSDGKISIQIVGNIFKIFPNP